VHTHGTRRADASGRRRPVPIDGSNFVMDCDQVIDAIGTEANPLVRAEGMEKNDRGYIIVDEESNATTRKGIFAGGDIARGSATVILAIGDAKKAARAVDAFLSGQ